MSFWVQGSANPKENLDFVLKSVPLIGTEGHKFGTLRPVLPHQQRFLLLSTCSVIMSLISPDVLSGVM